VPLRFVLGLLCFAATPAVASIVQTFPFSLNESGSGPVSETVFPSGFSTGNTVAPFAAQDGTLIDFTVSWIMNFDLNGTAGSGGGGGDASAGGSYYLNGIAYDGNGNGNGAGGPPGTFVDIPFSVSDSDTFLVSEAGITYDPDILAAVEGGSDFALLWNAPVIIDAPGLASYNLSINATATITYDYVPEPSALLPSILLIGVLATFRLSSWSRSGASSRQPAPR
jgi:hypothetical protein